MEKDIIDGNKLSQGLMDEAITLLFAGQDTSAATLSWTLHLLSLNPKVQDRLAKEVQTLTAEDKKTIPNDHELYISKKTALKMTYLDAVIKESMRLYPVAPFVVRKLPHDLHLGELEDDKKEIIVPKDTFACVWIYSLHRNPKLWHRPDDFVPERWIDPDLQQLDDGQTKFPGTFMPFAAGPRNCVGQPLAHILLRIILARIVNDTKVIDEGLKNDQLLPSEDIVRLSMDLRKDMQAGFTVLPSEGVWLDVL
jgi:cytochrome P450